MVTAFVLAASLVLVQGPPQATGFTPGTRTIFALNVGALNNGDLPPEVKLLKGNLELVTKNGGPMLKASSGTEFLVTLPELLPDSFTVEFALVPKSCCAPEDLAFEGTRAINQGAASARIMWRADDAITVVGGGETFRTPMPEDLKATLPGATTLITASFESGTVKLYTNGRRMFTLTDRRFVRGKVFRVFLGGQDAAAQAVHLASLHIATNQAPVSGVAASGFVPGKQTLFDLDMSADSLGTFPKQLKALKGGMGVVMKDGVKMLKASNLSEFLVPLPAALPVNFTLEFDLIPKECCSPQDLSFEGTPTIDQGPGSSHILWDSDGYLAIIGGGPNYESKVPEDLELITPGVLTHVWVSVEGPTVKLYTNGRRQYTLTDRRFARGRQLRVFLGAQDERAQAVHLARLRIAAP